MKHDPAMSTLSDAIDWLRARWDGQRTAPPRLTVHDTDGELGGLRYSGAFAAALSWKPGEARRMDVTIECGHPLNGGQSARCLECDGLNVKTVQADRYTYPMTQALLRLRRAQGNPHPLGVIYALAEFGWRPRVVEQVTGADQGVQLRAIRQLHGRYEAGPVVVAWTSKSESQQAAEVAA